MTDGYTYDYNIVLPVIYESAEALRCDFKEKLTKYIEDNITEAIHKNSKFTIAGHEFVGYDHVRQNKIDMPIIQTVDEWFGENLYEKHKK